MAAIMKIENFGDMQAKYLIMPVANRAASIMVDAKPALTAAHRILELLTNHDKSEQATTNLRKNSLIMSRIRSSEAKSILLDGSVDFIQATMQKIAQWYKTLQKLSDGTAKATIIKGNVPENITFSGVSNYLALIKLIVPELSKLDKVNEAQYSSILAELRRCSTILGDCECASGFNNMVLEN